MLISNYLLMSSANLLTRELDEPPNTISSTYTCTIRISMPYLRRNKVRSTFPVSKPRSNRNPLNLPYQSLGACLNPYNALTYTPDVGTFHSQTPLVGSHTLLPPTHS
jgi:hypothetical protein